MSSPFIGTITSSPSDQPCSSFSACNAICSALVPLLQNTAADYAPRPAYRPLTKFEQRGLRLGHGVWDLVFRKK